MTKNGKVAFTPFGPLEPTQKGPTFAGCWVGGNNNNPKASGRWADAPAGDWAYGANILPMFGHLLQLNRKLSGE